jgi:hypothetical protein
MLTFNPGVLSQTIPVTINPDFIAEGDETVLVTLSNAQHGTIGTIATTVLAITDDDAPAVFFSPAAYTVSEAVPSVLVTVKRSGSLTAGAQVFYTVTGGTATSSDFTLGGLGVLSFLPGHSMATFPITIAPDTLVEGAETINLGLSTPSGAVLGTQSTAVVTITDNDSTGTFSFSAPSYYGGRHGDGRLRLHRCLR